MRDENHESGKKRTWESDMCFTECHRHLGPDDSREAGVSRAIISLYSHRDLDHNAMILAWYTQSRT